MISFNFSGVKALLRKFIFSWAVAKDEQTKRTQNQSPSAGMFRVLIFKASSKDFVQMRSFFYDRPARFAAAEQKIQRGEVFDEVSPELGILRRIIAQ